MKPADTIVAIIMFKEEPDAHKTQLETQLFICCVNMC